MLISSALALVFLQAFGLFFWFWDDRLGVLGGKKTKMMQNLENGERKLDEHNHLIQKHDLEKIAKAFETWAKERELSFWK